MNERREMEVGDWVSAIINVAIGALLGSAAYGLAKLVASGAWLMAVILVVLLGGLFLVMVLFDWLVDRLFPIGIRTAKDPHEKKPKPLPRALSLPVGFILGVVLAVLGLDRVLLDLLP